MNSEKKILIAYFSAQGTTKKVAENLSIVTKSDLYEIKPEIEYTKEDLKWTDENARSSIECKNEDSRPKLKDKNANIEKYDIIFLGFPIWWYNATPIIKTFLESYNFNNKTIILFGTSGGSQFGDTVKKLNKYVKGAKIIEGKMLNSRPSIEELKKFVNSLKIL
jgi:flavodoxin